MKRVIRLLTVCFPLVSIADTKEIDGFVWEFAQCCDDGVELRGQQEWTAPAVVPEISGSLAVPSQINGATVLSIGYFSFYNFKSLASVKIPETVKHIGHMAFAGCDALEALYLPVGLETIDGYAVTKECAGPVLEIFYPGNLNQWLRLIGTGWSSPIACPNRLYLSDGLLENVTLSACKDIGEYAFFSCEGIKTLQICSDVASIGAYAFGGCSNLRSVEMVDGVTNIYVGAFSGCGALTSVRLSQALCSIGVRAFDGCKALRALEVPQAVRKIDDHAFIATGLESITFGSSCMTVGGFPLHKFAWPLFYGLLSRSSGPRNFD